MSRIGLKVITIITGTILLCSCGKSTNTEYTMRKEELEKFISINKIIAKSYKNKPSNNEIQLIIENSSEETGAEIIKWCLEDKGSSGDGFIDIHEEVEKVVLDINTQMNFSGDSYEEQTIAQEVHIDELNKDERLVKTEGGRWGVYRKDLRFKDGKDTVKIHDEWGIEVSEDYSPITNDEIKNSMEYEFILKEYKYLDNGLLAVKFDNDTGIKSYNYDELSQRIIEDGGRPLLRMINLYNTREDKNIDIHDDEITKVIEHKKHRTLDIYMYISKGKIISFNKKR